MKIKNLISYLQNIAPPSYQESYDNSGLITGNPDDEITGVLICLDSTEAVLDEAINKKCNLVIAHHPIIFKGLKSLTGKNYVERVIIKAIKADIAIYAIHTNLDNMYYQGVNTRIAEKLELVNTQILAPKMNLKKLQTFVAPEYAEKLRTVLFAAGAGEMPGFEQLSHSSIGVTNYNGSNNADIKLELFFQSGHQSQIIKALNEYHPAKQVPFEIFPIENKNLEVGAGMIGHLKTTMNEKAFLAKMKKTMKAAVVRYTRLRNKKVKKVAVCGGSGSFLLPTAIAKQADVFITADFKYHEFFDADRNIVIADIGHYESEQFTIKLLYEIITNNFSTFAAYCTEVNTNPVNYLH